MPVPTREPVPLGRSSQSARDLSQPGELVRTTPVCRIAAREPARATNAGGAAARDECVGHARGRSIHSLRNRLLGGERQPWAWRPSLLARCAALNQLLGRTAAAPRRGRPVRALGQRPARARPDAPLGCLSWAGTGTRERIIDTFALGRTAVHVCVRVPCPNGRLWNNTSLTRILAEISQ